MELLRLYATFFANPTYEADKEIKGQPIFSGHFRDGKQVFYPYHWIVRKNGEVEPLLFDNEIGWHAGNWEVNCRSVAIVFDNNFENSTPSKIEIEFVAKLIKEKYPNVTKERIFGHREINTKTTCPSNLFLTEGDKKGWKEDLLNLI
jgi:N-acetyl-anhydromuramyl-L-alanine amidase AmpD